MTTTRPLNRRQFICATAAIAAGCAQFSARPAEIIDCHTHFYDPSRPEGVPWPSPGEAQLYRRTLPEDYRRIAEPLGITGTVVVEASPWIKDNDWILGLARTEPLLRGLVGNLPAGSPEFEGELERLARNPLFRGIRLRDVNPARLRATAVLRDLRLLAEHKLSLDLNGGADLLPAIETLAATLPNLRILINHVANVRIDGGEPPTSWKEGMRAAAGHPNVYCKVSGLVEGTGRRRSAPAAVEFYRPVLDHVFTCFGEDRLIYGSNWPVSELFADLATVHSIVEQFFTERGGNARRKVFARNCHAFYRPVRR